MSADTDDSATPDIPDKSWDNPFVPGTWLNEQFEEIVSQHRDLIIILDDYKGRRGTGKTIASMQLANGMDQTAEGLTKTKVSLQPEEIREAYAEEPPRSGLVLDEAEVGASNRQAMSNVNQALREIMSMGRVEEKYVVVNSPLKNFIDKDIRKLCDVWISMTRKGEGLVHHLDYQPYAAKLLTKKKQWIEFEDIPGDHELRDVYNYLTREKRKRIRGEEGDGFIPRSEHREILAKAKKEARKQERNENIHDFYTHPEVREASIPQRVVADAAGVSQQTVANVLQDMES